MGAVAGAGTAVLVAARYPAYLNLLLAASFATIAEEVPEAYKDVSNVVEVVHRAGIGRKVARLRPVGVLKG